jgi:ABC-2 type transport system permease protein
MSLEKIKAIIDKEFDEIMKNKTILSTLLLMPLILAVIMPVAFIGSVFLAGDSGLTQNETAKYIGMLPGGSSDNVQESLVIYFATASLPFFMILPAFLPVIISSYSIIGEKKNRTLEPLLAAPVSVYDIMIGKALAALIPSLLATWAATLFYFAVTAAVTIYALNKVVLPDLLTWAVGMLAFAPLVAFLGIMTTILISSRVNDPRVAQQISALFIVPIMGLFMMQMMGIALIDMKIMLVMVAIVFVIDVAMLRLGKFIFDREEILTRWK